VGAQGAGPAAAADTQLYMVVTCTVFVELNKKTHHIVYYV